MREEQLYNSPRRPGALTSPPHAKGSVRSPDRVYDAPRMWDSHQQIKRLVFLGWTNKQIAKALGISAATVCNIRNSSLMKKELALMHAAADVDALNIGSELARLGPKSLEVIEEILKDEEAPIVVRQRTACTVLDRIGYGPISKVAGVIGHTHFTMEDIEKIKREAVEAGAKLGDVVDVSSDSAESCPLDHIFDISSPVCDEGVAERQGPEW